MDFTSLIAGIAAGHGLDPQLVAAIVDVESRGNTWAARYEPGYPYLYRPKEMARAIGASLDTMLVLQRTSWGLMQVMGATAYDLGFRGWPTALCDPATGIEYGCRYLARQAKRYKTLSDLIASYNAGTVRTDEHGEYLNRGYVSDVLMRMGLEG